MNFYIGQEIKLKLMVGDKTYQTEYHCIYQIIGTCRLLLNDYNFNKIKGLNEDMKENDIIEVLIIQNIEGPRFWNEHDEYTFITKEYLMNSTQELLR